MQTRVFSLLSLSLLLASSAACPGKIVPPETSTLPGVDGSAMKSVPWARRDVSTPMWPEDAKRVQVVFLPFSRDEFLAAIVADGRKIACYCSTAGSLPGVASDIVDHWTKLRGQPRLDLRYRGGSEKLALVPRSSRLYAQASPDTKTQTIPTDDNAGTTRKGETCDDGPTCVVPSSALSD
jgi:hypothetical protein